MIFNIPRLSILQISLFMQFVESGILSRARKIVRELSSLFKPNQSVISFEATEARKIAGFWWKSRKNFNGWLNFQSSKSEVELVVLKSFLHTSTLLRVQLAQQYEINNFTIQINSTWEINIKLRYMNECVIFYTIW